MKRDDALADLSRDHHHALVHAKDLVEHADAEDAQTRREQARAFLAFWDEDVAHHFTEEEHVILPLYQRHVELMEDDHVQRMLDDHAWFRDTVPKLVRSLDEGDPIEETMRALGERLHAHARFEDREFFPRVEETLSEAELELLHERSIAFRRRYRGEGSIGPKTSRQD